MMLTLTPRKSPANRQNASSSEEWAPRDGCQDPAVAGPQASLQHTIWTVHITSNAFSSA